MGFDSVLVVARSGEVAIVEYSRPGTGVVAHVDGGETTAPVAMTLPIGPSLGHAWSLGEPGRSRKSCATWLSSNRTRSSSLAPGHHLCVWRWRFQRPASNRSRATRPTSSTRAGLVRDCAVGEERLTVTLRPLRLRRIGGAIYETYAEGPFPASIDAIVIDGPPSWTRRGRSVLARRSAPPACRRRADLDDYERKDERRIVHNWTAARRVPCVGDTGGSRRVCARKAIRSRAAHPRPRRRRHLACAYASARAPVGRLGRSLRTSVTWPQ